VGAAEKYPLLRGAVALLNPIAWAEPFGMVMILCLSTCAQGIDKRRRGR